MSTIAIRNRWRVATDRMAIDGISRYAWGVPTKTYGQMCPLARSLDVLGERWTMLVIRELLLGPKRFKHLLAVLPAIGSNRLSERLRGLEEAGIIRKSTLPPPAAVAVYELTEEGERLRDPLIALGLWGLDLPVDDRIDPRDGSRGARRAVPGRNPDETPGSESPRDVRVPRRRRGVPFPAPARPVPAPLRPVADRPNGKDCLRPSDLHGSRTSSADAVPSAQGRPRDDPRRVTLVACRTLPRAGVHPPGASTSTPVAAVARVPSTAGIAICGIAGEGAGRNDIGNDMPPPIRRDSVRVDVATPPRDYSMERRSRSSRVSQARRVRRAGSA